jgi:FkbM family methyltransferase
MEHAHVPFRDDITTVLDVGASHGQFARFALHRWPDAVIHCFEPLPEAVASLESLPRNRVKVSRLALSSEASEAELHVSARSDSSSLLPIGQRQAEEFPGTHEAGLIPVRQERLDSVLSSVDLRSPILLKIDVQGAELDVLKGAVATLQALNVVYVECSFVELYDGQALAGEVVEFLQRTGFQMRGVYNTAKGRGGHCIQADLLFEREGCQT